MNTAAAATDFSLARSVCDRVISACCPRELVRREASSSPAPFAVLAVGKAAASMTQGLLDAMGASPPLPTLVILPDSSPPASFLPCPASLPDITPSPHSSALEVLVSDHPIPTSRSETAARRVLSWLGERFSSPDALRPDASLVLLLSGGASSLLSLPLPRLSLNDLAAVTRHLLLAGANIHELNTVRRRLDAFKGGRLARHIHSLSPLSHIDVFVLSDVLGDPLHDIASGPCAPDPTTIDDALAVLDTYAHADLGHAAAFLRDPANRVRAESLKPGDPSLARVRTHILANNALAVRSAVLALRAAGFDAHEIDEPLIGEAADAARRVVHLATSLLQLNPAQAPHVPPRALVWGGETTVRIAPCADLFPPGHPPPPSFGGRNQELALAAARELARLAATHISIATLATDGIDSVAPPHSPPAAGAVVSTALLRAADAAGISAARALRRHDSYSFFAAAHARRPCHLITGPTATNVNDVTIALTMPAPA